MTSSAEGGFGLPSAQRGESGSGVRIVAFGGGTGISSLLRGLKRYTEAISAVVTVTDNGGSSGRLRNDFDILAPGDDGIPDTNASRPWFSREDRLVDRTRSLDDDPVRRNDFTG